MAILVHFGPFLGLGGAFFFSENFFFAHTLVLCPYSMDFLLYGPILEKRLKISKSQTPPPYDLKWSETSRKCIVKMKFFLKKLKFFAQNFRKMRFLPLSSLIVSM